MNRLKQKLKSESGASVLLALLFLLICTLVASALLMAAVSNAGKIKSNQEVHQKYLTVSSAMELICEDLLSAEYYGKYSMAIQYQDTGKIDAQGNAIYQTIHAYTQQHGEYSCKLGTKLLEYLDAIFADQMNSDVPNFSSVGDIINTVDVGEHYKPNTGNPVLMFTVGPAITDGVEMGTVQVKLTLDREYYTINLEATLIGDTGYGMKAELTPVSAGVPQAVGQNIPGEYKTEPMKWKLGWITKLS